MNVGQDLLAAAAYSALGVWVFATVVVGVLYRFTSYGERFQPWLLLMCVLTLFGAILVARLVKSRCSVQGQ